RFMQLHTTLNRAIREDRDGPQVWQTLLSMLHPDASPYTANSIIRQMNTLEEIRLTLGIINDSTHPLAANNFRALLFGNGESPSASGAGTLVALLLSDRKELVEIGRQTLANLNDNELHYAVMEQLQARGLLQGDISALLVLCNSRSTNAQSFLTALVTSGSDA